MKQEYDAVFTTEVATIGIRLEGSRLIKLDYLTRRKSKKPTSKYAEKIRDKIERYLDANSRVKTLKVDVTLDVTPFQQKVLRQLELIPYGKTKTYGEIAKKLKTSPRAVGNACRNNPVPIIIPCHRVTAANGIGGYDGENSGRLLEIKRNLLALEGVYL